MLVSLSISLSSRIKNPWEFATCRQCFLFYYCVTVCFLYTFGVVELYGFCFDGKDTFSYWSYFWVNLSVKRASFWLQFFPRSNSHVYLIEGESQDNEWKLRLHPMCCFDYIEYLVAKQYVWSRHLRTDLHAANIILQANVIRRTTSGCHCFQEFFTQLYYWTASVMAAMHCLLHFSSRIHKYSNARDSFFEFAMTLRISSCYSSILHSICWFFCVYC